MSKQEQIDFAFSIAMHFYMARASAYRIEENFFIRGIKVLRPDVSRPPRQRLLGDLLDKCNDTMKKGVDRVVRQLDG